jgi:hypothetical protein
MVKARLTASTLAAIKQRLPLTASLIFRLNVSDEIRLTAYGEATVDYKGNPTISKG